MGCLVVGTFIEVEMILHKKFGVLVALLLVVCVQQAMAVANVTVTFDRTPAVYAPGETIVFTITSTSNGNNNKPYVLELRYPNGTRALNVTGTTTANLDTVPMFVAVGIPTDYGATNNSYANYTEKGVALTNPKIYFNTSSVPTNKYLIVQASATYNGSWYWDDTNALRAVVKDYEGLPVIGALCKVDIYDAVDDAIFYTQDGTHSGADGDVAFNIYVDYDTFDLGTYKFEINCQYAGDTILNSNVSVGAAGTGGGTFSVNPYVVNQSTYIVGNPANISTQTLQSGCVNFTNNYRDYTENYDITGQWLCSYPYNVQVVSEKFTQTVLPGAVGNFCLPLVVPEVAAAGSGLCRVVVGVSPAGYPHDMSSEFSSSSGFVNVTPVFARIVAGTGGVKTTPTTAFALAYMPRPISAGELIRVDFPDVIVNSWGWDRLANVTLEYNGTVIVGNFTVAGVAPQDAGETVSLQEGTQFARNIEYWFVPNMTIPANATFKVTLTAYSEASFWQGVLAYLASIASSLQNLVLGGAKTIDSKTIGNYTNVTGTLVASTIGTENLSMNYSIVAKGDIIRRNLHFVYEFAPVTISGEGAFVDQNPSIQGYQALSVYQAVPVNSTGASKSFLLSVTPNLAIGNYTMYETVYEVNSPQQEQSGQVLRDERLVRQTTYSLTVNATMVPVFDGDVVEWHGKVLRATVTQ